MNVENALRRFCEDATYMRGYSKDTVRRYKRVTRRFCSQYGIEELEQIEGNKVREFFLIGRTKNLWMPATFITYQKTLLVFFRWCVEHGHLKENYAKDIELPKVGKHLPKSLTKQDAMRLVEVSYNLPYGYKFLRYRNRAAIAMFLYAGLRRAELLNLMYADVDMENLSIFVRQGKGAKDRIIPMSSRLAEILEEYLKERRRLNRTCPEFFTSLSRNCGFGVCGLKRLIDRMKEASGIHFSSHSLRHTFATLMLEGGCDIYSLSKMMGHADIKTTTIYLAASAEHLREQMRRHPLNGF